MSERKPMNFLRWFWPKVDGIESAKFATQYGFWVSASIAVITYAVATISLAQQEQVLDASYWSLLDALVMGIVAWRIKNFSRAFAVGGTVFFIIYKIIEMPSPDGFRMAFILSIFLINGARGVFAYNRFKPTSIWGESSEELKPAVTVPLTAIGLMLVPLVILMVRGAMQTHKETQQHGLDSYFVPVGTPEPNSQTASPKGLEGLAVQVDPNQTQASSKPSGNRFIEYKFLDISTTIFDLSTVQIVLPGRFSIVSTTIDDPWLMNLKLKAFDSLGSYCARAVGKYPAPAGLLTLRPADILDKGIEVLGAGAGKRIFWHYPYEGLARDEVIYLFCNKQDQRGNVQTITNGFRAKTIFDCKRGLWGRFMDDLDHDDPSKVPMAHINPGSKIEEESELVCHAVNP